MTKFVKLSEELIDELLDTDLTAAEWRIWMFLVKNDPFGDKYKKTEPLEVMQRCRVSKVTFYRAIAKLQELELYDFQTDELSSRNLRGVSSFKNETETIKNETETIKNETEVSEMKPEFQECNYEDSKPAPDKSSTTPKTIQTYSDIKDTTDRERPQKINEPVKAGARPNQEGSVIEIFEKYREPLSKIGVYLFTRQNEIFQLNPKVEGIIQQAGCLPINQVEPTIKAFLTWARTAKDVKDIYRAFAAAIRNRWEES